MVLIEHAALILLYRWRAQIGIVPANSGVRVEDVAKVLAELSLAWQTSDVVENGAYIAGFVKC